MAPQGQSPAVLTEPCGSRRTPATSDELAQTEPSPSIRCPVGGRPRGLAGLTLGAGDTLWFSDGKLSRVGRLSLDGTITEYALPWGDVTPSSLASGPDGSLWIVDAGGSRIVHLIPPA